MLKTDFDLPLVFSYYKCTAANYLQIEKPTTSRHDMGFYPKKLKE